MRGFIAAAVLACLPGICGSCSDAEPTRTVVFVEAPDRELAAVEQLELAAPESSTRVVSMTAENGPNVVTEDEQLVSSVPVIDGTVRQPVRRRSSTYSQCTPRVPRPESASVECTFQFDPGLWTGGIQAALTSPGVFSRTRYCIGSGRNIRFERLEAGSATLSLVLADSTFEFARIENILVPREGQAQDTRLADIDLRGKLHTIRLRLLDLSGEPWSMLNVRVQDYAGRWADLTTNRKGWGTVTVPIDVLCMDAIVEGYHTARFLDGDTIHLVRN